LDDEALAKELLEAPELPEDIEFADLDEEVRRELRTLPKNLAETVGKHLVAAGGLIDTDPDAALKHARYAKAKASRVPIVREALGLVSYHAGNWAEALSELRAVRRMTRTDTHVAVIADAERALGRPERALDLAKEANAGQLPREVEVELRIVAAGARRDMGQLDAAVVSLQTADLDAAKRDPWSARLFYAYADNLAAAGRVDEAIEWFLNAADADEHEETDAAERAAELSADPADEVGGIDEATGDVGDLADEDDEDDEPVRDGYADDRTAGEPVDGGELAGDGGLDGDEQIDEGNARTAGSDVHAQAAEDTARATDDPAEARDARTDDEPAERSE